MKWFAELLGYADDAELWGVVVLLHEIDFEQYPNEHCIKAPELKKSRCERSCNSRCLLSRL